eukprot:GFKZ01014235.1.p1 GENE.GFKZ01014235.1~~GFKZ01014235.1.p1  ORF type:complete len:737 (+),score=93.76 GFKZ01014235.1:84-2213(+)
MCDGPPLSSILPSDYLQMPEKIDSSDPLLNVGKKELQLALRMPSLHPWIADWLFSQSAEPFHPKTAPLPPEAFDNSLAIHLHHDISTPSSACPRPPRPLSTLCPTAEKDSRPPVTVSKDIDLLLVPVLHVDGITAGYTFLKGVHEATFRPFTPPSPTDANPYPSTLSSEFIAGRFAFDTSERDFLMVVNSMSPHMTGIVSMRWRDNKSRDRSFFAIPKADYGPGNLPSRVLSVQCNVDYEVPDAGRPQWQFETPVGDIPLSATTAVTAEDDGRIDMSMSCGDAIIEEDGVGVERDFANEGDDGTEDCDDGRFGSDACGPTDCGDKVGGVVPGGGAAPLMELGDSLADTDNWAAGLESIGTVIQPFEDPAGVLPEILQDLAMGSQGYLDEVERVLNDPDLLPTEHGWEQAADKRGAPDVDSFAVSPVRALSSSEEDYGFNGGYPEMEPSWIFSSNESTPDGVGIPRRPARIETSAGAFDMSTLVGSLATIERSLKGSFYGPKVRKDILHPQTGELISRCTGYLTAKLDSVAAGELSLLRSIAAQAYYSSRMAVSNDGRLMSMSRSASPPLMISSVSEQARTSTGEPRRKQGRLEPQIRPAPVTLAPRPVPTIALPPGLPHPEVLQLSESVSSEPQPAVMDEQAAREAKLEAKRIKNRLSAARSNQKRRAQLEAQKKELNSLKERVQELKSRQKLVIEENEALKQQVASKS